MDQYHDLGRRLRISDKRTRSIANNKPALSFVRTGSPTSKEDPFGMPEADALTAASNRMAREIAKKRDDVLRAAISLRLGRDDWKPEDIRGRIELVIRPGDTEETVCLDGRPLIKFSRPIFESRENRASISQGYRSL